MEAAQKTETTEVLSKLKGLGNSILGTPFPSIYKMSDVHRLNPCVVGNFGLSTDNFKFEPDGKGGYSMNFVR